MQLSEGRRGPLRASLALGTRRTVVRREVPARGQLQFCKAAGDHRGGDSYVARPLWGGWVGWGKA